MKKFLKIFAALIVVLIIGITALIMLVDPNEYRGYMVQQVKKSTGYTLEINGDLRWHIWPQVSILVADVSVTAPGATEPLVTAANMRLDVELIPLFSKKLSVNQVMLNNAVVRLTDATSANEPEGTAKPEVPATTDGTAQTEGSDQDLQQLLANFDLNKFEIVDSLFILQQGSDKNSLLTVRDISLQLVQKEHLKFALTTNAQITRDQLNVVLGLNADLDLQKLPSQAMVVLNKLDYQLKGPDFPSSGLNGVASLAVDYNIDTQDANVSDIKLTANGSTITGSVVAKLGDIPNIIVKLASDSINVDKMLGNGSAAATPATATAPATDKNKAPAPAASTAKKADAETDLSFLRGLNFQLTLDVKSLAASGFALSNVAVDVENKVGKVQLKKVYAQIFGGSVSVPGSLNATGKLPSIQISPKVENIDLDTVTRAFDLPQTLSGKLNLNGTLSGSGLSTNAIKYRWNGNFKTRVDNARLNNLNLQQIIQQAAALTNKDVKTQQRYEQYTELSQLNAEIALKQGMIIINKMLVDSKAIDIKGSGSVSLDKLYCQIDLNVKLMEGWQGKKDLVEILESTVIPVRIYGPCSNLGYKVDVEKILRDQLKNQATKAIDKYLGGSDERKQEAAKKIMGSLGIGGRK